MVTFKNHFDKLHGLHYGNLQKIILRVTEQVMNSNTFLENNGNTLPIPARLPFNPAAFYPPRRRVSPPNLHIFSGASNDPAQNLYFYAIRNQRRAESLERLAFAALAGSSIAGVLSVFL
jgi:hypothetical protein